MIHFQYNPLGHLGEDHFIRSIGDDTVLQSTYPPVTAFVTNAPPVASFPGNFRNNKGRRVIRGRRVRQG